MTRAGLFLIVAVAALSYGAVISVLLLSDRMILTVAVLTCAVGIALVAPFLRGESEDEMHYPAAPDAPEQVDERKDGGR
jgi:membrane protein implicated in regulation of membrane protease activity